MSQGVAADAAGNEVQQAEPGDADNAADGVVQGGEEVQNDETPVIEEESVSPKGAMEAQAASPKVTVEAGFLTGRISSLWSQLQLRGLSGSGEPVQSPGPDCGCEDGGGQLHGYIHQEETGLLQ